MQDWEIELKFTRDFIPIAVAESVRKPDSFTFNAEVRFQGKHAIVAKGLLTREEALAIAQKIVDAMIVKMIEVGQLHVEGYPIAKE